MVKKLVVILLVSLFLLIGCTLQNQATDVTPNINEQKRESKMTKQQFEELFLKDKNNQRIIESFIVDFDMDGIEDSVILYADLENKSYSNIAVVCQNGVIGKVGLDAKNEYRFIEPVHANILQQNVMPPELVVRLQSTKDGTILEYNVTITRTTDQKETSFKISSKRV